MDIQKTASKALFYFMWWTIGLISLLDLYLALKFLNPSDMTSLRTQEKNPLVVKLIEYSGDLTIFAVWKIVGTLAALFICKKLYESKKNMGLMVCSGAFLCQIYLLSYLLI